MVAQTQKLIIMNVIHKNKNCAWFILPKENIYMGINNFQFTTKMSNNIDALVKVGCSVNQIYNYFQELGINIYEDHIKLYLKYGINYEPIEEYNNDESDKFL